MLCGSGFARIRKMEDHLNPDPRGKNAPKKVQTSAENMKNLRDEYLKNLLEYRY